LLVAGCGAAATPVRPDETLARYVAAVDTGDSDAAYDLLSAAQRAAVSRQEFAAAFRANRAELRAQARALRRLAPRDVPVTSEVAYADGESATVALEGAEWRIAGGVADAHSLRSPRETLRSLRRALERRSFDSVMRILSRRSRSQIDDELRRLVDGLSAAEHLDVAVDGDHARVEYAPGHGIDLVREDGEWRVLDLD
jgi:hypothetical protein